MTPNENPPAKPSASAPAPAPPAPAPQPAAASTLQTLKYDTIEGQYSITYDPAKIGDARIKAALFFSPYTSVPKYWFGPQNVSWGPGKYLLAPALELCNDEIPGYTKPCGFEEGHFLENAKVSLAEGERQMSEIKSMQVPAELEPIRKAFLKEIGDSLW